MLRFLLRIILPVAFLTLNLQAHANSTAAWSAYNKGNFQQAFENCQSLAETGDASCQALLGTLYKTGNHVPRNNELSLKWLNKSAESGNPIGQEVLGDTLLHGRNGVEKNLSKAYELFMKASARGNYWADNQLGSMYRYGLYVGKNLSEAFRYFQFAAGKGNPPAQANLADLYRLGEGTPKNPDLAFQWALKSSEQKWPGGFNVLGLLFRDGIGVRQDSERAISLLKDAIATKRSPSSYSNLGAMYFRGIGVPVNRAEARKWFEEGAKVNDGESFVFLSEIHLSLARNSPTDQAKAFEYATKAVSLNRSGGFNILGYLHREGIGTPIDYEKAIANFKKGIELSNPNSMVHLGVMYEKGLGITQSNSDALALFERAITNPQLGVGNRKNAEDSITKIASENVLAHVAILENEKPNKPVAIIQNSVANSNSLPNANDDKLKGELLDRLEKMQQQLTALQATSNTATLNTAITNQKIIFANRKALVIGNDKYKHVSELKNATSDARAISNSLTGLGYKVSTHIDISEKAFKQALRDFKMSIQGGDEVLVFFAGHGVQLGATNYLLPTDIKGDNEEQVKDEAIQLQRILDDMQERKAKFALAIIDACRDNPFKGSGRALGGRGLAPTTAATGQMVMFSAGSGQQALDKLGNNDANKNGLFTRILLKEMSKPGVPVDKVLKNVRNEVVSLAKGVGHEQTPALYDQSVGEFFFKQ